MKGNQIILIIISIGLLGGSLFISLQDSIISPGKDLASLSYFQLAQKVLKIRNSRITMLAVGDIMLDRGVEHMIKKEGKGSFKYPFLKIKDVFEESDLVFGNLEGPISDKGKKVGSIYSFRMDPKSLEGLKFAGFDVLSLANNHMFDYERLALKDTMKRLSEAEINYAGAGTTGKEAFSVRILEVKRTKIGFLAYTNLGPKSWKAEGERSGIAWIGDQDIAEIKKDIEKAKKEVDILIVSLHAGKEYTTDLTDFQVKFSKSCIGAGADMVLGHHSHVIQKLEKYKNGWVAYGLGNFIFDQSFSEETMEGGLLEVIIINGKIREVNLKKVEISESFQPSLKR